MKAWVCGLAAVFLGCAGHAKWMRPTEMPIERVLTNMGRQVRENPNDAKAHYLLARAHSYAFAYPGKQIELYESPLGYPPYLSLRYLPSHSRRKELAHHVSLSLIHYKRAVELDPSDYLAKVGYAWMLEQAADVASELKQVSGVTSRELTWRGWFERALAEYRGIHRRFRESDVNGKARWVDDGNGYPSMEAAERIMVIVEKKKVGKYQHGEKARLEDTVRLLKDRRMGITPLVVPLGADDPGSLVDWDSSVQFDLMGDGVQRRSGWVTPLAGLLCWDPSGRGEITSGLQLFGSGTFWMFFANGFDALAALDDDGDGWVRGKELEGVSLWHDADGDGVSDSREVRPVTEWGIVALRCRGYRPSSIGLEAPGGVVWRDGRVTRLFDWITEGR